MFARLRHAWDRLLFNDMAPIIRTGLARVIGPEDLPALPAHLDPRSGGPDFGGLPCSTPVRFLRGIVRVMRREFILLVALGLLVLAFDISSPLLVRRLLATINETTRGEGFFSMAVASAVGLCLVNLASAVTRQHYFNRMLHGEQRVVNGLNVRIFRHALRLTRNAKTATPVGDLVNHLSTDTDSIAEILILLAEVIASVATLVAVVGLLIWLLGPAGLVAVGVFLLLLPVTRTVARRVITYDELIMKKRDERVSLVSQVLSGIRIVKYFVWEARIRGEIEAIRGEEIRARKRLIVTESVSILMYAGTTSLVAIASFGTAMALGRQLDAPLVFSCVFLFNLLQQPFGDFPNLIAQLAAARGAAGRLIQYFTKETYVPVDRTTSFGPGRISIRLEGVTVRYPDAPADVLSGVALRLEPGEKLAVIGPVGCGKTTLLATLLGELEPTSGSVAFHGPDGVACKPRVAYASQEPFIMNASLRKNLTFGEEAHDLEAAIEAAALGQDLAALPAGLDTEIGEHGVNLSGGQKQRVCLARAALRRPDLALLDDPLSAVDERTEDLLVERLICGAFADTTLVMTTHRLRSLRRFDRILFLEAGRVVDCGTFDELEARCSRFRDFLIENERRSGAAGPAAAAAPAESTPRPTSAEAASGRITEDEDKESGAVPATIYLSYLKALGGRDPKKARWILPALALTTLALPAFGVLENAWLALWMNALSAAGDGPVQVVIRGLKLPAGNGAGLVIYAAAGLTSVALLFVQFIFWSFRAVSAGRDLHDTALAGVMGTRIRFFDSTPVGRVLNRFSRDVDSVERDLAWSFAGTVRHVLWTLGSLAVITAVLPVALIFILPALVAYYRLQRDYRATARETKRLHSVTRSPRFAHFKETLQGLTVLRAFSKQQLFLDQFHEALAENQRMFYAMCRVNRWFSIRIPLLSGLIALGVVIALAWAARSGHLAAGTAGLVLAYTLTFWGSLNWAIRAFSEAESRLTSVERLLRYARLEREPRLLLENSVSETHRWPLAGEIVFDQVRARYDAALPEILKGVSFRVPEGASAGIIGRTGSGKSTLFQVLFRLIDTSAGRILIDGHDIRSVPLEVLRRSIAIIPQDPMLFQGTLRRNLDRFEVYPEEEIWQALRRTGLASFVEGLPARLDAVVEENGYNFSQGQRQLFCLARALLTRARIIVLDEATASVDVETDSLIQHAIRVECRDITRLIIAHRTETLAECDLIIELADGVVAREIRPERAAEFPEARVAPAVETPHPPRPGVPARPFRDPTGEHERPKSLV